MKNTHFPHLAGLGDLKAWFARHLALFRENNPLAPRAIVLAGLPGTGKRSAANAIASELRRPLARFQSDNGFDPATVLVVEDLDREHLPLIRQLADPDESMPFVIALTEQPWDLPSGLFRPDAIESIWHLDLPDMKERAELWDLGAKRRGFARPGFDHVVLARASHELTHGEIHAAFDRAMRESLPHEPNEKQLFRAVVDTRDVGCAKHEDLARMTAWAARCASSARST
jgi:SpoVK/Ycf46/Vps4 family AAA+-type ATPase